VILSSRLSWSKQPASLYIAVEIEADLYTITRNITRGEVATDTFEYVLKVRIFNMTKKGMLSWSVLRYFKAVFDQ
jgi:hypothetical protein